MNHSQGPMLRLSWLISHGSFSAPSMNSSKEIWPEGGRERGSGAETGSGSGSDPVHLNLLSLFLSTSANILSQMSSVFSITFRSFWFLILWIICGAGQRSLPAWQEVADGKDSVPWRCGSLPLCPDSRFRLCHKPWTTIWVCPPVFLGEPDEPLPRTPGSLFYHPRGDRHGRASLKSSDQLKNHLSSLLSPCLCQRIQRRFPYRPSLLRWSCSWSQRFAWTRGGANSHWDIRWRTSCTAPGCPGGRPPSRLRSPFDPSLQPAGLRPGRCLEVLLRPVSASRPRRCSSGVISSQPGQILLPFPNPCGHSWDLLVMGIFLRPEGLNSI